MRKHPLPALLLVWISDLAGLTVVVSALYRLPRYNSFAWIDFVIWTILLYIAHLGVIDLVGLKVHGGWFTAIDFVAALVLPFPLFCLTMLIWFAATVANRIRKKHPEPCIGPDFNAANVTLNAASASFTYTALRHTMEGYHFGDTFALLGLALIFIGLQVVLMSTLLSLDLRIPWRKVGSLDADALVTDGMMVTAGALVGRIYQFDPFLLLLTLIPLLFLHKTLGKLNQAKLAYIDGKTDIYNYRYFDEMLTVLFGKAAQGNKPLSVVFGDMDHLRDVNNTYGHMVGDQALIEVARAFREAGGVEAIPCRFGGEEFVLPIADSDKSCAIETAERVRRMVATAKIPLETGRALSVTISLGVATYPDDAQSLEDLIKAADEAVYQAKHSGRNRVCAYQKCRVAL